MVPVVLDVYFDTFILFQILITCLEIKNIHCIQKCTICVNSGENEKVALDLTEIQRQPTS